MRTFSPQEVAERRDEGRDARRDARRDAGVVGVQRHEGVLWEVAFNSMNASNTELAQPLEVCIG